MPTPSPVRLLLLALDRHLADANITRAPSTNAPGVPPLWVEPSAGVPAPGDLQAPERDTATVLGLFYSGGLVGQRWERQATVDLWIRTKGNQAMLRAQDVDETIRDSLLGDEELRTNFLLAEGTEHELRVIEARVWAEMRPLERSAQAYTFITSYWFQLYRVQP